MAPPKQGPPVHVSDHWSVNAADDTGVVVVIRHRMPFESKAHCHAVTQPVQRVLDRCGRRGGKLLIDSRHAPPRNDAEYEAWFSDHRVKMVLGWSRVAILMKSTAGLLQTRRLNDQPLSPPPEIELEVFTDEAAAREFLARPA